MIIKMSMASVVVWHMFYQLLSNKNMQQLQASPHNLVSNRPRRASQVSRAYNRSCELSKQQGSHYTGAKKSREAYLSALEAEISELKSRIEDIEAEEGVSYVKNVQPQRYQASAVTEDPKYKTLEVRRTKAGRVYTRLNTPSSQSSKRPSLHPQSGHVSRYVDKGIFDNGFDFREKLGDTKKKHIDMKNPEQRKSYRVKHVKQTVMFEDEKEQIVQNNRALQSRKNSSTPVQEVEKEIKPPKVITNFIKEVPSDWKIGGVYQDFSKKITKLLQIPTNFPLNAPDLEHELEDLRSQAVKLYQKLGIPLAAGEVPLVRKFKNGLFYHVSTDRHLIRYTNGNIYLGEWQTDLPLEAQKNGFGFEYVVGKYMYLGQFKKGMRQGKGTIRLEGENGMCYDGEWAKGKPHGWGCHLDERGTRYIGNFVAGQKTGKATILNKEGLWYQGEILKGIKHGFGKERQPNGDEYEGQLEGGKFNGQGRYKWHNGNSYEGGFVTGKREGKGLWRNAKGDTFQGQYVTDIKNGWGKYTWANGESYEGQFKNDYRNGEGIYRYPCGRVGKFYWVDGKVDHRLYSKEEESYRERRNQKQEKKSHLSHPALRQ